MRGAVLFRRQEGLTLIELIIFVIVVTVGLTGVLAVMTATARGSADPVIGKQALATAEAMLEEILSKAYQNDPADPGNISPTLGCTPFSPAPTKCGQNSLSDRPNYNDVDDYNKWAQAGVTVVVAAPADLTGVTGKMVTVTVVVGTATIVLTGFRANI